MSRHRLIAPILALGLAATIAAGVDTAFATCDGGNVCSCGSTVDTDTVLVEGTDPVCSTGPGDFCTDDGLFVKPGIVLDLGGCTLRGNLAGYGIVAEEGAQVSHGKIINFNHGILMDGDGGRASNLHISEGEFVGVMVIGNGNTLEKTVVRRRNSDCVFVLGDDNALSRLHLSDCAGSGVAVSFGARNTVTRSVATGNGLHGIGMFGEGNIARDNTVQDNQDSGVSARGDGFVLAGNIALRNKHCGVRILGFTSTTGVLDGNQAKGNDGGGICVDGSGHTVSRNMATGNGVAGTGDGIVVTTSSIGNLFDGNRSTNNEEFGIRDPSTGGGTGGTANTYTGNICAGNGSEDSSPAGLCR